MIGLTQHFVRNWQRRKGEGVRPEQIETLLNDAIQVAPSRALANGARRRTLAFYWHPEAQVIIGIDDTNGMAVKVLTPDMEDRGKRYDPKVFRHRCGEDQGRQGGQGIGNVPRLRAV